MLVQLFFFKTRTDSASTKSRGNFVPWLYALWKNVVLVLDHTFCLDESGEQIEEQQPICNRSFIIEIEIKYIRIMYSMENFLPTKVLSLV